MTKPAYFSGCKVTETDVYLILLHCGPIAVIAAAAYLCYRPDVSNAAPCRAPPSQLEIKMNDNDGKQSFPIMK
jgi:hypothetical protein